MSLADVKTALENTTLTPENEEAAKRIIDAAIARGGMTEEEREQLLHILEVEGELADIEISAAEDALKAIEAYDEEVTAALETAANELEEAGK